MNRVLWLYACYIGVAGGFAGCSEEADRRPMVRLSAAASLGPMLETLAPTLEAELGVRLQLNLAGSGTLARQLLDGAPADAVILAHPNWLDPLIDAELIATGDREVLAGNRLVVVGRRPAITLDQLRPPRFKRVAWGDPASVPAGRYAEQALRSAGVWDALQPGRVTTADVRAALRYAEAGEVDAAVVYVSDAVGLESPQGNEAFAVICEIDPATHDPIAIVAGAVRHSEDGRRLLAWLRSDAGRRAFAAAGFTPR